MTILHFVIEIVLSDLVADLRIRRARWPIKKHADVHAGILVVRRRTSVLSYAFLVDEQVIAAADAREQSEPAGRPTAQYRDLTSMKGQADLIRKKSKTAFGQNGTCAPRTNSERLAGLAG